MNKHNSIIEAKLSDMSRFIKEMEEATNIAFEDYIRDFRNVRTAERDLELLIELSTDIIAYIFAEKNLPPPDSYREVFLRAAREKLLDINLSEKLVQLVSLRNRIVHEYSEEFNPREAYESFHQAPQTFRDLMENIFQKINK